MTAVRPADRAYRVVLATCAGLVVAVFLTIAGTVGAAAWPAVRDGVASVRGGAWDPARGAFGVVPAVVGTLASAGLALVFAAPAAVGTAVFLVEVAPRRLARVVGFAIDLLAAIPSVVYGLWGVFVLIPLLRTTVLPSVAGLPGIGAPPWGPGVLAAGIVLALMVVPYIAAVSREVLRAVPEAHREAALALGATRWEMLRDVVLPAARAGVIGAIGLGFARAIGETIAVTMVIGNRFSVPRTLTDPATTLASLLAHQFGAASSPHHVGALMAAAALLLATTIAVHAAARWLVADVGNAA
jgi:phosphate transport system permease protein